MAESLKVDWASAYRQATNGPVPTAQQKDELIWTVRVAIAISIVMVANMSPWSKEELQILDAAIGVTAMISVALVVVLRSKP